MPAEERIHFFFASGVAPHEPAHRGDFVVGVVIDVQLRIALVTRKRKVDEGFEGRTLVAFSVSPKFAERAVVAHRAEQVLVALFGERITFHVEENVAVAGGRQQRQAWALGPLGNDFEGRVRATPRGDLQACLC